MAGRTLGNNSLWSIEDAEALVRQADKALNDALKALKKAVNQSRRYHDAIVTISISDAREDITDARAGLNDTQKKLRDAKRGEYK